VNVKSRGWDRVVSAEIASIGMCRNQIWEIVDDNEKEYTSCLDIQIRT